MSCNARQIDDPQYLFAHIVAPHLADARRLARSLTRNNADAEDVLQDASVRLFRFIATYRGGNARGWVLRVVRNTAFSWLKSNRLALHFALDQLAPAAPDLELPVQETDPAYIEIVRAETAALHRAIGTLPLQQREVLVLKHIEDRSYREIADALCIPIGTVMSRLARARRATGQTLVRHCSASQACDASWNKTPAARVLRPTYALQKEG